MNINIWPEWHIVGKIGSGSFGSVYEIHRGNGDYLEKAAMKVIRIPSDTSELMQLREDGIQAGDTESYLAKQVEDIRREIGLMQRFVGFSNIVSYEDYTIQRHAQGIGWDILIRMELLTGLSSYMVDHILTEGDVLKLGLDISQALMICHRAGIIHRDIKPQNIFLNSLGFYKLGDFGISRPAPQSGSVMSFKGTVSYMAPETFSMRSTDARSDIYSLALVMYRILNGGREPFLPPSGITPAQREAAQHRRLMGEPLPRPERGSDMLWRVLATALAPDPAARYQTAEQFHEALQKAAGIQRVPGAGGTQGVPSAGETQRVTGAGGTKSIQSAGGIRSRSINSRTGSIRRAGSRLRGSRKRVGLIACLILASVVLLASGIFEILEVKRRSVTKQVSENTLTSSAVEEGVMAQQQPEEDKKTVLPGTEDEKEGSSDSDDQEGGQTNSDEDENADEMTVTFQDEALEQAVREALGIWGRDITAEEAAACTDLRLTGGEKSDGEEISDLTGISAFTNLEVLYLSHNKISDISELGLIPTLKVLKLEYNYISDLTPIASLSNLEQLEIRENTIHDISPVASCPELKVLDFKNNVVDDISSLQDLTSLIQVVMSGNRIESLEPVRNLQNLWYIGINNNPVDDITPLRNLDKLTTLCMSGTNVADIEVLFELPALGHLEISGCSRIKSSDVKRLKEREGLTVVD